MGDLLDAAHHVRPLTGGLLDRLEGIDGIGTRIQAQQVLRAPEDRGQ